MNFKKEKTYEIARKSGATEGSKDLWVMSSDVLEKFAQLLIEEHQNRFPKWLQVVGIICAFTGVIYWLNFFGNFLGGY